jgi:hypothetical protein
MFSALIHAHHARVRNELDAKSRELELLSVEWPEIRAAHLTYMKASDNLAIMYSECPGTKIIDAHKFVKYLKYTLQNVTGMRPNHALAEMDLLPRWVSVATLRKDLGTRRAYYADLIFHDGRGTGEYFLLYRTRLAASVKALERKAETAARRVKLLK